MMKYLICNADDFGGSESLTDAIIESHHNGIISSATLMTNMPAVEYACQKAFETPSLGVGIHLNLTSGKPISRIEDVSGLVDADGRFLNSHRQKPRLWFGKEIYRQVFREFYAQIKKSVDLGLKPTHCDSHHHITRMPVSLRAMVHAAREFGISTFRTNYGRYLTRRKPSSVNRRYCLAANIKQSKRIARWIAVHVVMRYVYGCHTPDRKIVRSWFIPKNDDPKQYFIDLLANLPDGISEMSFHPGFGADPYADESSDFGKTRVLDLELLTAPDVIRAVTENNIQLISFAHLNRQLIK